MTITVENKISLSQAGFEGKQTLTIIGTYVQVVLLPWIQNNLAGLLDRVGRDLLEVQKVLGKLVTSWVEHLPELGVYRGPSRW